MITSFSTPYQELEKTGKKNHNFSVLNIIPWKVKNHLKNIFITGALNKRIAFITGFKNIKKYISSHRIKENVNFYLNFL